MIELIIPTVGQGLLWAVLALGVYLTFRVLDVADLTVEGSFPLGAAVAASLLNAGVSIPVSLLIAVIAGMMIIPAVYVFAGQEGLDSAGPGLIFVTLPKVFSSMGAFGEMFALLFFVMVLFAALTSAVSILEAIVSSMMDRLHWSRQKSTLVMAGVGFLVSVIVCLGYNKLYFEASFATVVKGQILDLLDYASNNLLMPIVAILTCILVGWVVKPKTIIDEVTLNGEKFGRKTLYVVMIKFVAPVLLLIILLGSFGIFG